MAEQDIISKLKLEKYPRKLVLNLPDHVIELGRLEFDRAVGQPPYDLILAFVLTLDEMAAIALQVDSQNLLDDNGALYFAYPKKGNKIYSQFIGRDDIFPHLHVSLATGLIEGTSLKFNSMVAFNDTFTALGLKRLGAKALKSSEAGRESQSSNQYIDKIPEIEKWLASRPEVLAFFKNLTPGYQKDWARFVYSAKTAATVEKRLLEMADMLAQGYKSLNLYRQAQK